jgi:hypothetical protein
MFLKCYQTIHLDKLREAIKIEATTDNILSVVEYEVISKFYLPCLLVDELFR